MPKVFLDKIAKEIQAQNRGFSFDKIRDGFFAHSMKMKGCVDFRPEMKEKKIRTCFGLTYSFWIYGFANTMKRLSRDSRVFDSGLGLLGAKLLMTRFIAGRNLKEAISLTKGFRRKGLNMTFACEIEGENDPVKQDQNLDRLLEQIEMLKAAKIEDNDKNISVKMTAWAGDFSDQNSDAFKRAYAGLKQIVKAASEEQIFVRIDLEEYKYRDASQALYLKLLLENKNLSSYLGLVVQAYLKDSKSKVEQMIDLAKEDKVKINIRLVKGAYLEKERSWAKKYNYDSPICDTKEDTDANYLAVAKLLIENQDCWAKLAFGTMNPLTVAELMDLLESHKIAHDRFEFQQLYGMLDGLSCALVKMGYRVRKYVPYADKFSETIMYFARRLNESPGQAEMVKSCLKA